MKKKYQCEDCNKVFDETDDIVAITPAQSTGLKKKIYLCSKCYDKEFNKTKED